MEGLTENVLRPIGSKVWLNEMKCTGEERQLWECGYPGPGWGISTYRKATVKKIKCSSEAELLVVTFVEIHNTVCTDERYNFKK